MSDLMKPLDIDDAQKARTDIKLCLWKTVDFCEWMTTCGNYFYMNDNPNLCGMKYCCYCGAALIADDTEGER